MTLTERTQSEDQRRGDRRQRRERGAYGGQERRRSERRAQPDEAEEGARPVIRG